MICDLSGLISILIGCVLFVPLVWAVYKKWRTRGLLMMPGDWPLIGHLLMFAEEASWEDRKAQYLQGNGVIGTMFICLPVFLTNRLDILEDLLSSQKYLQKGFDYWVFKKIMGLGLLTSDGELWRKRRKMITPAFHFNILDDFATVMENKTFELLKYLQEKHVNGEAFDVFKMAAPFSMSIICDTAMGLDLSLEETNTGSFKMLFEKTVTLLFRRIMNPLVTSDFIYSFTKDGKDFKETLDGLSKIVREMIETRIRVRNNTKDGNSTTVGGVAVIKRRIFIDILLDSFEKEQIDVNGMLDEVNTFINAGYETTSTSLSWALYCLARNQRVQDKLLKELDDFGKSSSLTLDDFKEMKYLDHVIKETMRLYPTIAFMSRSVPDGTTLGGITFPACTISVEINCLNRNPDVWENPMDFNPERFKKFEENKRNPFVYIPFSAGPRNCIGQKFAMLQLKIALYHLIRAFRVTSSQKESDLKETFGITHQCENGLFISLHKRN